MKVKILGDFSYQTSPETEDMIEVSPEDLKGLGTTKIFDIENNCIKDYSLSEEVIEAQKKTELRAKRRTLLTAFDKWEKAVLRGREADNGEIMAWYESLLDLNENSFIEGNIPARIKYYL